MVRKEKEVKEGENIYPEETKEDKGECMGKKLSVVKETYSKRK